MENKNFSKSWCFQSTRRLIVRQDYWDIIELCHSQAAPRDKKNNYSVIVPLPWVSQAEPSVWSILPQPRNQQSPALLSAAFLSTDCSACLLEVPAHLQVTWGPVRGFKLSLCQFQQQPVHLPGFPDGQTDWHLLSHHTPELCWAPQHPRMVCSVLPFHPAHILIFPALINWFVIPRAFQVDLNKRFLLPRKRLQLEKDLELQLQGI